MTMSGYVYVLSNPAMPGLMKIGRSIDGGRKRAQQIYQTGVPSPFLLEFEMMVSDCVFVEQLVHQALWERRVSGSREFFKLTAEEAQIAVISASLECFGMVAVPEVDLEAVHSVEDVANRIGAHPIIFMSAIKRIKDEEAARCFAEQCSIIEDFGRLSDVPKKATH